MFFSVPLDKGNEGSGNYIAFPPVFVSYRASVAKRTSQEISAAGLILIGQCKQ